MQYIRTIEGYPALLATRTRSRFFLESTLMHGNRKSPWVYLTQNPKGRWQVLAPDGHGSVQCIAGGKTAAQVIHIMTSYAFEHGILKRGGQRGHPQSTKNALFFLGSFVTYEGNRKPAPLM